MASVVISVTAQCITRITVKPCPPLLRSRPDVQNFDAKCTERIESISNEQVVVVKLTWQNHEAGWKRSVGYHANFTITYWLFEQKDSFRNILPMCPVGSKYHLWAKPFILIYFARKPFGRIVRIHLYRRKEVITAVIVVFRDDFHRVFVARHVFSSHETLLLLSRSSAKLLFLRLPISCEQQRPISARCVYQFPREFTYYRHCIESVRENRWTHWQPVFREEAKQSQSTSIVFFVVVVADNKKDGDDEAEEDGSSLSFSTSRPCNISCLIQ